MYNYVQLYNLSGGGARFRLFTIYYLKNKTKINREKREEREERERESR